VASSGDREPSIGQLHTVGDPHIVDLDVGGRIEPVAHRTQIVVSQHVGLRGSGLKRGEGGRRYVAANRGTLQRLLMLLQPIILTAARAASASR
jgi:hypothetical protein